MPPVWRALGAGYRAVGEVFPSRRLLISIAMGRRKRKLTSNGRRQGPSSWGAWALMHPAAIERARSRLRVAKKAIKDLGASRDMDAFHDAWHTFLTSTKNVYDILKMGANTTTAQSRQWYGGKARERKGDPLLQYVYEARNADEHGLSSSVERKPGSFTIPANRPGFARGVRLDGQFGGGGRLRITSLDGNPVAFEVTSPHAVLVPITARGNRVLQPPETHLGKPLTSNDPVPVAEYALAYLDALVEEASKPA
jgi:hypothetical protein